MPPPPAVPPACLAGARSSPRRRRVAAASRRAVARPAAAAFALPIDDLRALAASAGLEWVNSDAEQIRSVQEAMASEPKPVHVPRAAAAARGHRRRPAGAGGNAQGPVAAEAAVRAAAQRAGRPEAADAGRCRAGSGQALQRALVGRLVHQLVPGQRRRSAAAAPGGAPRCRDRAASGRHRRAAAGRPAVRRPPRRRPATGCTAAPCRSRRPAPAPPPRHSSARPPSRWRAPSMLRSSLKIAPVKPSWPRRMSFSQRGEKPAGRVVDLRVDHVRRHHAGQAGAQPLIGQRVVGQDGLQRARVDRHRHVAVGLDVAVAGEMLAAVAPCRPAAGRASGSWPAA